MNTIVAISTAPGIGAIGIIRISGDQSILILSKLLLSQQDKAVALTPRYAYYGKLVYNNKLLDNVIVTLFKSPKSYTGEDLIEISCHGGRIILNRILNALINEGAVMAEPGEFTKKAFLNGKMDLMQAEAVEELIKAENELALDAAQELISGKLSDLINSLKQNLIDIISEYEAEIEFPDEADVTEQLALLQDNKINQIEKILDIIDKMVNSFEQGILIKEGFLVAIFGAPNTGKSTLLNQLVGFDRALVSNIPGTTRDYIKEKVIINGVHVTFIDMAGIRAATDEVEKIGIEHSKDILKQANAALFIVDGSRKLSKDDILAFKASPENIPKISVINKSDKPQIVDINADIFKTTRPLNISALKGDGIQNIISSLQEILQQKSFLKENEIIITHIRHSNCLTRCLKQLKTVKQSIKQNKEIELITMDLQDALQELKIMTGNITADNILNNIFSNFCIGK